MTQAEFKRACKTTIQEAFRSKYGCKPPVSEIELLEAHSNRTYILAKIGSYEYTFRSFVADTKTGSVWVAGDRLEQTGQFKMIDGKYQRVEIA